MILNNHTPNPNPKFQSGYNLKDVYIRPGPGGTVLFENEDIFKLIEVFD